MKLISFLLSILLLLGQIGYCEVDHRDSTLAPRISLTIDKFKELFLAGSFLLSHKAVNKYIKMAIERGYRTFGRGDMGRVEGEGS